MKHLITLFILLFVACTQQLAAQTLPGPDASPADIAYLRDNGKRTTAIIRVVYGRPAKKGRTMLGGKEPFGKVWRAGANETTEIRLLRDITFGDKTIPAGTYSLYAIPDKTEWTIIFNSKLDTWGAFEYDESQDVARLKVPVDKTDTEVELFTITFDGGKGAGTMMMAWENTLIKVPVKYQ
jgi:hypothetical protein